MNPEVRAAALRPARRAWAWLLLGAALLAPVASGATLGERRVEAHGARDAAIPAWTISTLAPAGWKDDCCTYAAAIGVDFVLYAGEWTGNPQGVMVLNVWPRKLPSLEAEVQADRKRYLQHDPAGKADDITLRQRSMDCRGILYRGSDKIDDMVMFCDPGAASGIRLSWSMAFDDADHGRRTLLDRFMAVVMATRYRAGAIAR